jgi:hypothetical protein
VIVGGIKNMKSEDYFLLALVFGIVALLSLLMRGNPWGMWLNSNTFPLGFMNVQPFTEIEMYVSALSLFIFLPSSYLTVAFAVAGLVKAVIQKIKSTTKQ